MVGLQFFEFRDYQIESFVPAGPFEPAVPLYEWIQQPIWMMNLQVGRYALGTEAAFINREIVTRLETYDVIVLDQKIHAALHRAIRTVRWYNSIYHAIRAPASVRRIMQMRTKGFDDLSEILYLAHKSISRGQTRIFADQKVLMRCFLFIVLSASIGVDLRPNFFVFH